MVLTLLDAWPEAARRETGSKMLALHIAAQVRWLPRTRTRTVHGYTHG